MKEKGMPLIATGNTAEVFDYADGKILKLFKDGYPEDSIKMEFNNVAVVNKQGIPSPKVYEIVYVENRCGIVYEKLTGNDLLKEIFACLENLPAVEKLLTEFSNFHKDFLSHRSTECISYKDYLKYFGYPDADSLPDGDFLCHGDFHFANLMRNGSGESEDSGKLYAIDFMNLCHGPKEYDVARAYVLIVEDSLPKDMPEPQRKMLLDAKAAAGKIYLEKMGFSLEQLKPFIPAVEFCRKREML